MVAHLTTPHVGSLPASLLNYSSYPLVSLTISLFFLDCISYVIFGISDYFFITYHLGPGVLATITNKVSETPPPTPFVGQTCLIMIIFTENFIISWICFFMLLYNK